MKSKKPWLFFALLLILSYYTPCFSTAADTLSPGHSLSHSKRETMVSQGGTFELGFFQPGTSLKIYLGIWYKRFGQKDNTVWIANRESPLSHPSSSILILSEDGNLLLFQGSSKIPVWSTNLTFPGSNLTEAVLGDDGNFVLRDRWNTSSIFWQSFDHPTNILLPGAKLGVDKVTGRPQQLISWKNSQDPSPGVFSFGLHPNGSNQICLEWNKSQIYWSSGLWNGTSSSFAFIPEMGLNHIYKFSFMSNENGRYFTYFHYNPSHRSKYVMDSTGHLQLWSWLSGPLALTRFWSQPAAELSIYALCGAFGVYRENFSSPCECLKGFEPFSMADTRLNDWSGGCVRKSPLQCENNTYANGTKDWFLKISNMQLPVYSKAFLAVNASRCELACIKNCSCTAYAYNRSGCMIWEGALLNLQQLSDGGEVEQDIYLKLSADEHLDPSTKGKMSETKRKNWKLWVLVVVFPTVLILYLFFWCSSKGKLKSTGQKASSNNLLLFDFDIELDGINDGMNTRDNLEKIEKKDAELPLFSYESVSSATNNFSAANKLGEGGFGPVYKGKSLKGQEIAIKMLSKISGQGLVEFRNETILIAKLQHRNLVRIMGCCIERDEKMLIYEYMPNKSLDLYLFDQTKKKMLDWGTRIRIIEGIAQGLLYLHQYSRLRIIHRDLKPSNILLDSEMNPKISDFGMARIVGNNETQTTHRIVGTYGYMSPEYAMDGLYSIKSDVFSFGVLVLEIMSGKKNTGFYNNESLNLVRYAWELWRDDQSLDLMEPTIGYPSSTTVVLRFINIGLLCVQESPTDRPTMPDVISMISNEHVPLPTPKKPAFTRGRSVMDPNSTSDSTAGNCSKNNLTFSTMEAR